MRKRRGSGFFAGIFVGVNDCINDANGVNILIKTKTIVPIILNER